MTDRENLLTALLEESDRRAGAEIPLLAVTAMLEQLGAEHRRVAHQPVVVIRLDAPTRSPNHRRRQRRERPRQDSNLRHTV